MPKPTLDELAEVFGCILLDNVLGGSVLRAPNTRAAKVAGLLYQKLAPAFLLATGPIGSRADILVTMWMPEWESAVTVTGCYTGTLEELIQRIQLRIRMRQDLSVIHGELEMTPPVEDLAPAEEGYVAVCQLHQTLLAAHLRKWKEHEPTVS